MRVWTFDSAVPLPLGRPRQRLSEALRVWLAERSTDTRHITIDLRNTESDVRLMRAAGDLFVPPRGRGRNAKVFEPRSDHDIAWLSPARRDRLGALLQRNRPDLMIVTDPLLAPLVPQLMAAHGPVTLIDDGEAAWHELVARRLPSTLLANWHVRMAQLLRHSTGAFAPVLAGPVHPGPGLEFTPDERYFQKIAGIVTLATGHAGPDRLALAQLDHTLTRLQALGQPRPDVVLVGFGGVTPIEIEGAVHYESWMHLEGLVGSARALVLPVLSPQLAVIARAALALGTPVVTTPSEATLAGLSGVAGLSAAGPDAMPGVLARLLDPDLAGPEDWRAIAEAARSNARVQTRSMRPVPGLGGPIRASAARRRRIPPLTGRHEVLYNPLSRMLMVRLQFRRDSGAEDVRLIDALGNELIRLMPNVNERRLDPVRVEGGVVTDLASLGGHLTIELHDAGTCLQSVTVVPADFVVLEAEIAWVHQDGVMLNGALWVHDGPDAGPAGVGIVLSSGDRQVDAGAGQTVSMPEIGGHAVRFSVPLGLAVKTPLQVSRRLPGPWRSIGPLEQRALVATPALVAPPPAVVPPELAALRDRHRGQRGWIIGNGPSVRLDDLAAIPADDVKFCFNRFYLSYDLHPLREDYVVSADTLMVADFGQDMIDLSTGLPLFCLSRMALPRLDGPHVVLSPFDGHLPLFSMNPAAFVGVGGSSVCVALQMAHYMGLRDVVLYGIDYSFSMKLQRDPRFPFPVSFDDGNHFITSYRSAKPWCPPTWRDISAGFLNARVAFDTTGGRVRNATRGGKLETFERVDFDTLLALPPATGAIPAGAVMPPDLPADVPPEIPPDAPAPITRKNKAGRTRP